MQGLTGILDNDPANENTKVDTKYTIIFIFFNLS